MIFAGFWNHPAVIGILIGLPGAGVSLLLYRRSVRGDEAAKQAAAVITEGTTTKQVVDGLNTIVTIVQADNKVLREELARVRQTVETLEERFDKETKELHAENEALRIENRELKMRITELEKRPNGR